MTRPCFIIVITGTVQGVGFRPFVYRVAMNMGITGDIRNQTNGVSIRAYCIPSMLSQFIETIKKEIPPLAKIRSIDIKEFGESDAPDTFVILDSTTSNSSEVDIPADTATCDNCREELFDPSNRRNAHPFINCTDCGPRFSIITGLPYDRPQTTMASFQMCARCRADYTNPTNRRFHAQPVACHDCGPRIQLLNPQGDVVDPTAPISIAAELLSQGQIIAIQGIGGFHLACRADIPITVRKLRYRKNRDQKPFAVMVKNILAARTFADISDIEERLLLSPQAPIVLLKRLGGDLPIAPEVSPGLKTLGIMLPYTPVHHLLFSYGYFDSLVMTSANLSDEPMVYTVSDALHDLGSIADFFLVNNRPIAVRIDDSITRVIDNQPVILRRARGFAPEPIPAPIDISEIVALGGIMKNTIAVGRKTNCYLSQYLGNAEDLRTIENADAAVVHLCRLLDVPARRYVIDMHPNNPMRNLIPKTAQKVLVQHHHAHAAACMAENDLHGNAICVVFDGAGYGSDNTIWGGEFFVGDYKEYRRVGHCATMAMPGGDAAVINPWRMAIGALYHSMPQTLNTLFPEVDKSEMATVIEMCPNQALSPRTSSMGRLFDSMAALLGLCMNRSYEGQPAMLLENAADTTDVHHYGDTFVHEKDGVTILDGSAILLSALNDRTTGTNDARIAARFHTTIANATAQVVAAISRREGLTTVCLSGGCFQNALLLKRTRDFCIAQGLSVVIHRLVSPNDECIAYGQAVIAAARAK